MFPQWQWFFPVNAIDLFVASQQMEAFLLIIPGAYAECISDFQYFMPICILHDAKYQKQHQTFSALRYQGLEFSVLTPDFFLCQSGWIWDQHRNSNPCIRLGPFKHLVWWGVLSLVHCDASITRGVGIFCINPWLHTLLLVWNIWFTQRIRTPVHL